MSGAEGDGDHAWRRGGGGGMGTTCTHCLYTCRVSPIPGYIQPWITQRQKSGGQQARGLRKSRLEATCGKRHGFVAGLGGGSV